MVLVIDDEKNIRELLAKTLTLEGLEVFIAEDVKSGLNILDEHIEKIFVIIIDVRLPDGNGIDVVKAIKDKYPYIEIIVLTAYGKISDGVRAMKNGAYDYIIKGEEDDKIVVLVEKAVEKAKLNNKVKNLEKQIKSKFDFSSIIGVSDALKECIDLAKKVAPTNAPVLLTGDTGTGKELFAQAIHYSSLRNDKPFIVINCSAIPKDLLESEFFGYTKGAFTGAIKDKKGLLEEANTGTLFLDEISEMPINLQSKLLRVLEMKVFNKLGSTNIIKIDVRIISASNRDLIKEINENRFKIDLYYRLSTFKINLPALKNRKEDIELLTYAFLKHYSKELNKNISEIDNDFLNILKDYDFPGNIRELRNIIQRSIILTDGTKLLAEVLPMEIIKNSNINSTDMLNLDLLEREYIKKVLRITGNDKREACKILGISLATLYRKINDNINNTKYII